jgi:hypothetical protein
MPMPRNRTAIDDIVAVSLVAAALDFDNQKKHYPCDAGPCPYTDGRSATGMYFCRDNCGLGVDEDSDGGDY